MAFFEQSLNQKKEARAEYSYCLEVAQKTGAEGDRALALNNLGVLNADENRKAEARNAYEEALRIRRKLAEHNPDTYLPKLADTLNNLGNLDPMPVS